MAVEAGSPGQVDGARGEAGDERSSWRLGYICSRDTDAGTKAAGDAADMGRERKKGRRNHQRHEND